MARFAPFCRSVDAHLYAQWIHRLGRAVVEVSPPLGAKQNGSVTLLCDITDHPDLQRRPGMNLRDAASVVRACPVQAFNLVIGLHDLSPVSGTESRFPSATRTATLQGRFASHVHLSRHRHGFSGRYHQLRAGSGTQDSTVYSFLTCDVRPILSYSDSLKPTTAPSPTLRWPSAKLSSKKRPTRPNRSIRSTPSRFGSASAER
jgi:hypothetical protein